jgi:NitT/TauT family transport system permease protein
VTATLATRPRPSWVRALWVAIPPLIAAAVFFGIWYLSSALQFDDELRRKQVQPYPHEVAQQGYFTWRNFSEMLEALGRTTIVALLGLAVAMALGVAIAIVMSLARPLERTLYPYAIVLQTLPIVAITPLMIIWFGTGRTPRVIVCVLISIFPIITNTLFGLKSAERGQRDLFKLHGAGRFRRLWNLDLPSSLPAMFTGFRISAGLSVIGAIVGEFFFKAGPEGIGRRIGQYTQRSETAKLIAAISLTAALGLTLFLLLSWLGNRVTRHWRAGTRVTS